MEFAEAGIVGPRRTSAVSTPLPPQERLISSIVVELNVLGTPRVFRIRNGKSRPASLQPKRAVLLAYLALAHTGRPCPRGTIVALFWPELAETRARGALRKALHDIRAELGAEVVKSTGDHLELNTTVVRCDALEFREHIHAGRDLAAVSLYTSDMLDGFCAREAELERIVSEQRRGLREMAYLAAIRLATADANSGNLEPALFWARRAEELSEDREEATRLVMSVLHQSGNRAAALARYAQLTNYLSAEYAVGPSPETAEVAAGLRSVRPRSVGEAPPDFFRDLVETAAELIYTTDAAGYFTYVNDAAVRVLGYAQDEIVGRVFIDFVRPDHRAPLVEFYLRQVHDQTPVTYREFVALRKDGSEIWIAQNAVLVTHGAKVVGMRVIARDVTARKLRERVERRLTPPFGSVFPPFRS